MYELPELPYAAEVAKKFNTEHHTLTVKAPDMRTLLPQVAAQLDEPFADVAAIPTYLLAKFAREHVTVALTGEGADEFFGGYAHLQQDYSQTLTAADASLMSFLRTELKPDDFSREDRAATTTGRAGTADVWAS